MAFIVEKPRKTDIPVKSEPVLFLHEDDLGAPASAGTSIETRLSNKLLDPLFRNKANTKQRNNKAKYCGISIENLCFQCPKFKAL